MPNALAEQLRSATADVHRTLEDTLDLLRDDLSLPDYVDVLRALYGYVAPWEARVEASGWVDMAELAQRRHAPRLAADLQHFDQALDSIARADGALPWLGSPAAVLGSRYVMEGSTLGGRVVGPHLERRFGLSAGRGCSWFAGHGERTGSLWRAFRQQLADVPEATHRDVVAAARDTFDTLARWLVRVRRTPAVAA